MVTGGEPGGPCISEAHVSDANSAKDTATGISGKAWATTRLACAELKSEEDLMAGRWSGIATVLQQECDCGMLPLPHFWAMRLQQARSAAVIALACMVHAMIGVANSRSDSRETPTLPSRFIG